jgi:hypothetical protein
MNDPLIGKCFVWFGYETVPPEETRKVTYQGVIKGRIHEKLYLVQFFNWIAGEPTNLVIVELKKMIYNMKGSQGLKGDKYRPGDWLFFDDDEHLRFWLEKGGGTHRNPLK